jgi:hypothetical protein
MENHNTKFETLRTKRLELLRVYTHFFLREDCLPISTCSFLLLLSIPIYEIITAV